MKTLKQKIVLWLSRIVADLRWRYSYDHSEHLGISLRVHTDVPDGAAAKLKAALDLINDASPICVRRIQRYLSGGIAVHETDYATAWFDKRKKAFMLGQQFVLSTDTADLSCAIVHEACHARIDHFGINHDEAYRLRIERLCMWCEIVLAKRLMASGHVSDKFVERLNRTRDGLTASQFDETSMQTLRRKAQLQRLRSMKPRVPRWMRRCLVVTTRKRLRRWQ